MAGQKTIPEEIKQKAQEWTSDFFDADTRKEVQELINKGGDALIDAFYKDLEFGTGGMRGVMGAGTNRINEYTLGQATQGLSSYMKKQFPDEQNLKAAIAYDCRRNSDELARVVAEVFTANGIEVFLFDELRPTPELSFAVRHLNCHAGIVLTASHNPPEYNGYKVYWSDGAQLVPPHDKGVIELVRNTKLTDVQFKGNSRLINKIGKEVDDAYIKACVDQTYLKGDKSVLSIVFTSLHGTSIKVVPKAFERAGFTNFTVIEEQAEPDGEFPTVKSPNPEEPEALKMAVDKAEDIDADIIIGTDPDGDRLGVGIRNNDGDIELLNGNQTVALLTWYLLQQWNDHNKLNGKQYVAQTIVTSELPAIIAASYGVPTYYCLTGFKWIADIIRRKEGKEEFIGGGEESYGYMAGEFLRDKDAVSASLLFAELALYAKRENKTVFDILLDIYVSHGFYLERLISITKKGQNGADEIREMMRSFRTRTPDSVDGSKVIKTRDYDAGTEKDPAAGSEQKIDFPKSNVFQIFTEDGTKITARPSGTEPKIKFYLSVNTKLPDNEVYEEVKEELEDKLDRIQKELGI